MQKIVKKRESYPVATDSDVQDEEHGLLGQVLPDTVGANLQTSDAGELHAVLVPGDDLLAVVGAAAVELDAVDVIVAVVQGGSRTEAIGLVAAAARGDVAVHDAVHDALAVDVLHDVDLAALGPGSSLAVRVAQSPECRPDALLARSWAGKTERSFDAGHAALGGSEGVLALHAARGPFALRILQGDDLERVHAAVSDVGRIGRVRLQFIVEVLRAGAVAPGTGAGEGVSRPDEGVLPFARPTAVVGRVPCRYGGEEGRKDCEEVKNKHCERNLQGVDVQESTRGVK